MAHDRVDIQRVAAVTPHRFLIGLLQPLLALLLVAGLAQAELAPFDDGERIRVVETLPAAAFVGGDPADSTHLTAPTVVDPSDDGTGPVLPVAELLVERTQPLCSQALPPARIAAPASHPPRASPSTGPPLV